MQNNELLPIGTILDSGVRKYEIKSVLGKGGFGITYLAVSTIYVDNIPVVAQFAIKEHYISSMNERQGASVSISNANNTEEIKESIDSFLVEAQRLNKLSLNHSGVVRVNESFRANGTAYYVMEYIKGQSLREYVKQSPQGRLDENDALKLFYPIAKAIGYLHDNRVTHLDIKPDNILIRENGDPVVIDFGLSKHYSSKGTPTSTIKAAGCSLGYSPMEQYAGLTTFTPEADIYALGATLLFMLTGKDPMRATEINETIIKNIIPQGVTLSTLNAISHSMAKLKENRIRSVSSLFSVLFVHTDGDITRKEELAIDVNKTHLLTLMGHNRISVKWFLVPIGLLALVLYFKTNTPVNKEEVDSMTEELDKRGNRIRALEDSINAMWGNVANSKLEAADATLKAAKEKESAAEKAMSEAEQNAKEAKEAADKAKAAADQAKSAADAILKSRNDVIAQLTKIKDMPENAQRKQMRSAVAESLKTLADKDVKHKSVYDDVRERLDNKVSFENTDMSRGHYNILIKNLQSIK